MYRLLDTITKLEATSKDVTILEELCDLVKNTSLCGLGQSAPNSVLSTLRYFSSEYKDHIAEHKCVAGVCGKGAQL
jgi:NADH:ubiquinone oxidoreductase subunit F (NADH-binding)